MKRGIGMTIRREMGMTAGRGLCPRPASQEKCKAFFLPPRILPTFVIPVQTGIHRIFLQSGADNPIRSAYSLLIKNKKQKTA